MATLATTRYVEVGVYIGQFFLPGGGSLPNEVRVPCLVAKGDRLFVVRNTEMRRSFRFQEQLTFTTISPFTADLDYASNGQKALPVRLYTSDGNFITENKWDFVSGLLGANSRVQIKDTEYDGSKIYFIDYQTTSRELSDPIPDVTINGLDVSAQVRQIIAVGPFQDQQEYVEYVDFFDEFEVDEFAADDGNANLTRGFSAVNATGATGTGTAIVSTSANYSHPYNRVYRLEVTAAAGVTPTRTATLAWNAIPVSTGNSALPPTPLNAAQPKPTISLIEATPLTLTNQLLELGVVMDFDFGASNFNIGDVFYVQANGIGLIELDPLLSNTNQYTQFGAVDDTLGIGSTGSVAVVSLPSEYTFTDYNTNVRLEVFSVAGGIGSRQATIVWAMYGMTTASGSFTVSETTPGSDIQPLGATGISVELDFGATHYVVGDRFQFQVLAPRRFYKGKESIRNITLSVSNVVASANATSYQGGYVTDTPEGRFGTWTAATGTDQGRGEIPDGVRFYVRNTYLSTLVQPIFASAGSRVQVADKFATQARSLGLLSFGLQQEVTDILSNPSEIGTDTSGAITGTVNAKYITLNNIPDSILRLERVSDDTPVAYVQIPGTQFLRISEPGFSVSDGDLRIIYVWHGPEPEPGQTYFLSGKYLRPPELYERPFLFLTLDDAQKFLAPSTVRNDAYIGAGISFDYAIQGLFVIQVRDSDDDGTYSKDDYRRSINAFLEDQRATDLVVLNNFSSLGDQLNIVNRANDPFERHECLTYIGTPIGTPIGSENEPGSLVFFSRRTLAVYGQSPAHGSRILVAPTKATRTITLDDGSSTTVTLDGSFVAASVAALVASFADPRETILRKNITSFDTMEVYRKEENAILGGNNIVFFNDLGEGVFRVQEDVTTDPYSPDTLAINQMTQKQFVTKDIRRTLDNAIIGTVFPSATAGVATIQDVLVTRLRALVTRSLIGQYQNEAGGVRGISAADVSVFRDTTDPTLFHIGYNYFLATVAKRIFGLFTVNLPGGFPR